MFLVQNLDPGLRGLDITAELFHEITQGRAGLQFDLIETDLLGQV